MHQQKSNEEKKQVPMDNENSLLTIRSPDPLQKGRNITDSLIDMRVFGIENCWTKSPRYPIQTIFNKYPRKTKKDDLKKKGYFFLRVLVVLFMILFFAGVAEGATPTLLERYFSDESGILELGIKNNLNAFNSEHTRPITLFVRKKSLKETQQNPLEDALRVFEQQRRKVQYSKVPDGSIEQQLPALLLYYNAADRVFVVVQQKDKVLEDEEIQAIQNKYQEQKRVLKAIPMLREGGGDEIKKATNALMVLILGDLMAEVDKKEKEEELLEQRRRQDADNLCSPLKDGICSKTCTGVDLDCLCGDGICQYHETRETCPKDCGEQLRISCSVISDGICVGNCITKDIDCYFEELAERAFRYGETKKISAKVMTQIFLFMVIILSVTLLILLQIFHLRHQKEKQKQVVGKDDFIQRLLRYQEKEQEQAIRKEQTGKEQKKIRIRR